MERIISTFSFVTNDLRQMLNTIATMNGSRIAHNVIDPTSMSSVIRNPKLPVCFSVPNQSLELGTLISFYGTIQSGGKTFRIDFLLNNCQHDELGKIDWENEIALHFNPRLDIEARDVVVMNSFFNGKWEQEERHELVPFVVETPFHLMFLVEEENFKIAVNGRHLYEFKHRYNFRDIARMQIEGDIRMDLIEFRKELRYLSSTTSSSDSSSSSSTKTANLEIGSENSKMITNPTIPYLEYDKKLTKMFNIYIAGMIPNHIRENFVINLANSFDQNQRSSVNIINVPVHISIRTDIKTIVRNTLTNGVWGDEEIYLEGPFNLIPGLHFDMMISNKKEKVVVAINGQPAFEYIHRHDPTTIDTFQITGGIFITSIRYEYNE